MNQTNPLKTIQTQTALPLTGWETRPALNWTLAPSGLARLAESYAPISLEQMEAVALLDRTDTKFVMPVETLLRALGSLQGHYWMLSVQGQRLNHYRTLYFDTPNFDLYNLHVNDRAERYKVRSREYTDSGISFLEVKHKTRKDRTIKDRILTVQPVVRLNHSAQDWLHGYYPYEASLLEPKLWNTFTRITLVSQQFCERVTLDVDLSFYSADKIARLDGLAIAEVKMGTACGTSPFLAQMRALRVQPQGFSKYCIGVAMLYSQVKKNAIKPRLLAIHKMIGGMI